MRPSEPCARTSLLPEQVFEHLRPWIREQREASEWPGTKLYGHTARLTFFAFNEESVTVLKESAVSLYQWQQPALPEDLCLLRPGDEPWLVSIAHERDSYLAITEEERDALVELVPELATKLRYS